MGFNWFESILFGLFSGLADILPVSAQAHKLILLKMFGSVREQDLLRMLIHIAVLAALYFNCSPMIIKMGRARRLARVPKKRRKRPLDTKSLMDFSLLRTILIPVIISFFFYEKASTLGSSLIVVACFVFLNGLILYIPQYLPSSNKDSRMLSRVEGFLIGLGGAISVIPGISGMGAALSAGSICGVEKNYGLSMAFLMNMSIIIGRIIFDIVSLISVGIDLFSFSLLLNYFLCAIAAFLGAMGGIRIMRHLAVNIGFTIFAYYCWGIALFTFVLNLMA